MDVLLFLLRRLEDLQKALSVGALGYMTTKTRSTNLERAEQALVHAHHGAGIVKLAAVVGGAEERHELTLGEELVAVLDDLVSTADEVHVVFLQEAGDDVWAKGEGDAAVVLGPAGDVLVRIGPEQIAEEAAVGDLEMDRSALGSKFGQERGRCFVCSNNIHQSGA